MLIDLTHQFIHQAIQIGTKMQKKVEAKKPTDKSTIEPMSTIETAGKSVEAKTHNSGGKSSSGKTRAASTRKQSTSSQK